MAAFHRRLLAAICFNLLLCALPFFCRASGKAAEAPDQLSPALSLIAEDYSLIKTGQAGSDITFSANDFSDCIGVKKIGEIMITSLPPATSGSLRLGDSAVLKNQVIARSRLNALRFVPLGGKACEGSFTFRVIGSEEYELTCRLYLLDSMNYKPSTQVSAILPERHSITTYENIAVFQSMHAADPENDQLTYEIVEYPKKGVLAVTDRTAGTYTYTPVADFVGKDSFVYEATDRYGNRSETCKVEIRVIENEAAVVYSDLLGKAAQYPALRLTASGIMHVRYENGSAVFQPEEQVTRLDFLVMAMQAAGYRVSTAADQTPFADDRDIPAQAKGYVSAAVNMGFIHGVKTEGGLYLYPNAPITRAESAVILSRMIRTEKPVIRPVFSDSDSIPTYALDAIHSLNAVGILEGIGSSISPNGTVTRSQSARILCAVMDYLETAS